VSAYQVDAHGSDDGEADADGGGQLLGGKVDRALAHLLTVRVRVRVGVS